MKEDLNAYQQAYTVEFPYHWDEKLLLDAYSSKLVEHLKGGKQLRLLSLGLGGQVVSRTMMENLDIKEYVIVEGSDAIIAKYRLEVPLPPFVSIHQAYFEEFQPTGLFDAIEMGFILEHVDDPGLILRRFKPFLKADGVLFVSVPNARSLHRLIGQAAGLLPDLHNLSESDLQLGHKRYFDSEGILELVSECGYQTIGNYGLVLKPLTTGQLRALDLSPKIEQALVKVAYELPDVANGILLVAQLAK